MRADALEARLGQPISGHLDEKADKMAIDTVGQLIAALKQFNANTPVEVLVGNEPSKSILRVETFPHFMSVYITAKA